MTSIARGDLPPKLAALVDDATSEAKRRGHGEVTPAHLALVLNALPDAPEPSADVVAAIDAYLSGLEKSFETPVLSPDTQGILASCAAASNPLRSTAEQVQGWVTAAPEPTSEPGFVLPPKLKTVGRVVETVPPVVSRDDVVLRLLAMLTARDPQTPLVVAPEGHGRTGLARCLASTLADLQYDGPLAGWPVVRVRCEGVIAEGRGDAVKAVFGACRGKALVYVDDVEVLTALGSGGSDVQTLAVLRSSLHDPELRVVMAVASEFVERLQVADSEFFDELDRVDLNPLSDEEVLIVARQAAIELADHHGVTIGSEVVAAAVSPARQIDSKGHPSLVVARLDRAAAAARLRPNREATIADLGSAVGGQQYLSFDPDAARVRLRSVVLGQDEAIDKVANRLALTRASLDTRPERPDGVFLLAGPTGTGKTALALALAEEVFGTRDAVIRLDMSEFSDSHTVSKLIGSPPGFVGSTDPESWMTTKVRRRPQSVVLLDEIEKAHPVVWNTFLQVFDAGRLTDSQGRVADFRDVIVVLTTNMGAAAFAEHRSPGFLQNSDDSAVDERQVREEIKDWMRPELLNRLDAILVFRPLSAEVVREIVVKQVQDASKRLGDRGWQVRYDDAVIDVLCRKGYSKEYGARPLLRALEEDFLGKVGRIPQGPVRVHADDGEIVAEAATASDQPAD